MRSSAAWAYIPFVSRSSRTLNPSRSFPDTLRLSLTQIRLVDVIDRECFHKRNDLQVLAHILVHRAVLVRADAPAVLVATIMSQ